MTTTHSNRTHHPQATRKLDLASLALVLCGLLAGVVAYLLITQEDVNPLVLVPAVVALTTGLSHLIKWEAPHDRTR